jgi:amino acid permease
MRVAQAKLEKGPAALHLCSVLVSVRALVSALQCESGAGCWALSDVVFWQPKHFGERRPAWDARSGEPRCITSSFLLAISNV